MPGILTCLNFMGAILMLLTSLAACNSNHEPARVTRKLVSLELRGQLDNGYQWQHSVSPGEVVELDQQSTASYCANVHNGPVMGAPTATIFIFKALKPGNAFVQFTYKHKHESIPQWVAMAKLQVDENRNVKVISFVASEYKHRIAGASF